MKQILCSILVLCLFAGCASVDTAGPSKMNGMKLDDSSNFAHVNARTWGLNFFPQYPVLYPSEGKVNIQTTTQLLTNKARDIGADTITDIESDDRTRWLPYLGVFWLRTCEVSANVYKK